MTKSNYTVKELASYLLDLIDEGYGNHTIDLSVNYDNCDHIQPLKQIYVCKDCKTIDWITLRGKGDVE